MTTRTFATYSTEYTINGRLTDGSTVVGNFVLQNVPDTEDPCYSDNNNVSLLALAIVVDGRQEGGLPFSYTYSMDGASTVDLYIGAFDGANDAGAYTTYTYHLVSTATDFNEATGFYDSQAYNILSLHFTTTVGDDSSYTVELTGIAELSYEVNNTDGLDISHIEVPFDFVWTTITAETSTIVCYAKGTMIQTMRGLVRVEKLKLGEMILTVSGKYEPLKWLGFRTVDCKRHSNKAEANPVRIVKHAFGHNQPARDLYLSPLHSIYVDGILIPAIDLVNGVTVLQETRSKITYFHVELPTHNAIYAEGLTAETYLDDNNRDFFMDSSSGQLVNIHAEFSEKQFPDQSSAQIWAAKGFAKVMRDGPQVDAVKERLLKSDATMPVEGELAYSEHRLAA
jgi:hypothetical protein